MYIKLFDYIRIDMYMWECVGGGRVLGRSGRRARGFIIMQIALNQLASCKSIHEDIHSTHVVILTRLIYHRHTREMHIFKLMEISPELDAKTDEFSAHLNRTIVELCGIVFRKWR